MQSALMLIANILSATYTNSCNAECHYAERRYVERRYVERHYAECRYTDRRSANGWIVFKWRLSNLSSFHRRLQKTFVQTVGGRYGQSIDLYRRLYRRLNDNPQISTDVSIEV